MLALHGASSAPGALIRAGLHGRGVADDNNWDIGQRIVDYGAQAADGAGHKHFASPSSNLLQPGWYLMAVGVDGANTQVHYAEWMKPGLYQFVANNSRMNTDMLISGPTRYLNLSYRDPTIRTTFRQALARSAQSII